ncbi:MAG TPA: hypothetical protein VMA73_19250 [Streptosporangiaceae bacterium]|nr:hypothetical protein [Streptosporangiaceae bacterium]
MRVSSDPAESTSTLPLCFEEEELVELGEELPQAATASPMQAMDASAAIGFARR